MIHEKIEVGRICWELQSELILLSSCDLLSYQLAACLASLWQDKRSNINLSRTIDFSWHGVGEQAKLGGTERKRLAEEIRSWKACEHRLVSLNEGMNEWPKAGQRRASGASDERRMNDGPAQLVVHTETSGWNAQTSSSAERRADDCFRSPAYTDGLAIGFRSADTLKEPGRDNTCTKGHDTHRSLYVFECAPVSSSACLSVCL